MIVEYRKLYICSLSTEKKISQFLIEIGDIACVRFQSSIHRQSNLRWRRAGRGIVGGLGRISKATANARYPPPVHPPSLSHLRFSAPPLVPGIYSYGIENTRLTILAGTPAELRHACKLSRAAHREQQPRRRCKSRDAGRRGRVYLGFLRRAATAILNARYRCEQPNLWANDRVVVAPRRRKLHRRAARCFDTDYYSGVGMKDEACRRPVSPSRQPYARLS